MALLPFLVTANIDATRLGGDMLDVVARPVNGTGPIRLRVNGPVVTELSPTGEDTDVWISPGFLDIQVNGYAGRDVRAIDVDADTISGLVRSLWPYGITALCPTVTTGPEQRMINSLRAIAAARSADPLIARAIPCIHVEGPHLSIQDGPRGAHNADHVRPPDLQEFDRWQQASGGTVGVVTVAPELPGAADYIHKVANAGTVVALGHTAAEPEDIARGVHAAMAIMTTHHWSDLRAGLTEMKRVARRQVVFTWDPQWPTRLWVVDEYLPEIGELERSRFAPLADVQRWLDAHTVTPFPIPWDFTDGYQPAYWRRPEAYLDPTIRAASSTFATLPDNVVEPAMARLSADLRTGAWLQRHQELTGRDAIDYGYRLLTAG